MQVYRRGARVPRAGPGVCRVRAAAGSRPTRRTRSQPASYSWSATTPSTARPRLAAAHHLLFGALLAGSLAHSLQRDRRQHRPAAGSYPSSSIHLHGEPPLPLAAACILLAAAITHASTTTIELEEREAHVEAADAGGYRTYIVCSSDQDARTLCRCSQSMAPVLPAVDDQKRI